MQYLGMLIDGLVGLLDVLELFFFAPISEVLSRLSSIVIGSDGTVGTIFGSLLSWILNRNLGLIGDITLVQLLLGGGILVFLVYRLALFLVPVAD